MHGLEWYKKPFRSISTDFYIQYIGCFSWLIYGEILGQPKFYWLK